MNTSRRRALQLAAAAASLPLVHIRTAGAAGKLRVGFIGSFVPGADEAMAQMVADWADRNKVDVQVDFFSPTTNQTILAWAAEAQARTGHDMLQGGGGLVGSNADLLEPADAVVARLHSKYGEVNGTVRARGNVEGRWIAVPTYKGSHIYPCAGRIDLLEQHAGLKLTELFPAAPEMGAGYADWTWDSFLHAAKQCNAAGVPFGLPISHSDDADAWLSLLLQSFGAALVDAGGKPAVDSEAMRAALAYLRELAAYLPPDVYSWDNASNNRALVAGRTALIVNPPSAWAQAKKDRRDVAEQCWHFPMPAGPAGRFAGYNPHFWGVWSFSPNKRAAFELIEWLSQREQAERICTADAGFDVPPFVSMSDFAIWRDAAPPAGTLSNYPLKPGHHAVALLPTPPTLGLAIYNSGILPNMVAKVTRGGQTPDQAIAWAARELEGIRR